MAFTQPVWSLVDEAHHADYVIQLSHGVYPVATKTLIDARTLQVMQATGVYRAFYPSGSYPAPDLKDIGLPPAGMTARADAAWMRRHLWQLSQEAIQPPLYYLAMVPAWMVANALGGPFAAVYVLRLINALLVAALAPMAVAVARVLVPSNPAVATVAAVFAALLPGLDLNLTRVSNDTLATVAGGLLVLLAVRSAGARWSWRRTAGVGLLLGVGLLVKVTLIALYPALAVSLLWPFTGRALRAGIPRCIVLGGVAAACLVPWSLANLAAYGAPMPNPGLGLSDSLPTPLTLPLAALNLAVLDLTYWTGEPWGFLPLAAPFAVAGALVAAAVVAAVITLLRRRARSVSWAPAAVAVVATGGMLALSPALAALASFEFVAPGRYGYPALPAAAALCALGVVTVAGDALRRRIVVGLYATAAAGILVASAAGVPARPSPGPGAPPATSTVAAVSAAGDLQGMRIAVDRVAFDDQAKATWLHVTASNSGLDEAEWPVTPDVTVPGASVSGDYLRSTHLAGDLDPGQAVSGWLYLSLDPATLRAGDTMRVRFTDVAVDRYATVADVSFELTLPGRS